MMMRQLHCDWSLLLWIWIHLAAFCLCAPTELVDEALKAIDVDPASISPQDKQAGGARLTCATLKSVRPEETLELLDLPGYVNETHSYWSATAFNSPACVYNPANASDVSIAIKSLAFTKAKYAVKGGGHSPFPSWSGEDHGVVIATQRISDLTYDASSQTVRTGMGNRWADIYAFAQKYNSMVVGGRVTDVGTGLALGGGLSHFSNEHGLAVNNIISYEMVLADGSVQNVTASSLPDLFWALKGGSSNFGVVTHMTLKAYPLGRVWGGQVAYSNSQRDALMEAFAAYQAGGQVSEPRSALLTDMIVTLDTLLVTLVYMGELPVGQTRPPCFQPFYNIPAISDATRVHSSFTDLLGAPINQILPRWTYGSVTMLLDRDSYVQAARICQNATAALLSVVGAQMVLIPQPISLSMLTAAPPGSIPIGYTRKPQLWFSLNIGWTLPTDDETVYKVMQQTLNAIDTMTKYRGTYDPFLFLNDAASFQDVFSSYGQSNRAKLQAVSRKYDPSGMFQTQMPGGFKVFPK